MTENQIVEHNEKILSSSYRLTDINVISASE